MLLRYGHYSYFVIQAIACLSFPCQAEQLSLLNKLLLGALICSFVENFSLASDAVDKKVAELMQYEDLDNFETAVEISVHGLSIGELGEEDKTATDNSDPVENLILREMTTPHS